MKTTKKTLIKKLDALASKQTREMGRCEKCWKQPPAVQLQTHHVYGRVNYRLRWEPKNLVCLCAHCHIGWAEVNPLEFADWFRGYRITDAVYLEQENAKGPIKRTLEDYQKLYERMK